MVRADDDAPPPVVAESFATYHPSLRNVLSAYTSVLMYLVPTLSSHWRSGLWAPLVALAGGGCILGLAVWAEHREAVSMQRYRQG